MTTTDLGACELFVSELRRSGLIERGQLEPLLEDFSRRNPRNDAASLAEFLVAEGTLTKFQAERVMQGKTQGMVLGPYVLTEAIGSGSMGSVHKARSKNDGKCYAVKVLPRRSMWNVRLARRQVRAFSQFSHPVVVPFVDVGTAGGAHYLVWNYVEGETLESLVQRLGRLDPATCAQVGQQIAAGLGVAHANGLFHGLLKPSNVMIGPGGQLRILDFGIGSLLAENEGESLVDTMSTANTLTSGLDCASPESIMEPTNRTPAGDQYSLGCMLYYCLTGRYPFAEGSAVEKMMAHQFKQPTPVSELALDAPAELAAIVERLMHKKPEERFAGVHDAIEAFAPLAPASPSTTLVHTAGQALTQTPTPSLTPALSPSGLGAARYITAPPAPRLPGVSPLVNPDLVPRSQGGAWPGGSTHASKHSGVHTPTSRSAEMRPMAPTPPAAPLPTRRSLHGVAAPVAKLAPSEIPQPQRPLMPTAGPQWASDDDRPGPASRLNIGPLGMLALGATVAITCFMLVHHLLK